MAKEKEPSVKWLALGVFLAAMVPLSGWLRRNPHHKPKIWLLMGFLPFEMSILHSYLALNSWAMWPGHVKGAEFSVLDGFALAIYFSLPHARHRLPFTFSMAFYFAAALLSVFQADVPMPALFYLWQLARMFLVYAVVARASTDPRVAPALLTGMAAGIIMEAGYTVWERFGLGILQATGTLGHQNTLGMVSHFVIFPFFALFLEKPQGWLTPAVVLAGLMIQVLTGSRATLGLGGFGYAAVYVIAAMGRWTSRKALVSLVAVAAIVLVLPLALTNFAQRGEEQLSSSNEERVVLSTASAAMLADHPWGVGANHYVLKANAGGYYQRADVAWTSYSATVHNVYWLVAVETGYVGLIAFLLLLIHPMIVAFRCSWRNRGSQGGSLLLGLGVALLTVYIHSMFEWIFITFSIQYIFAMELGLVAGLAEHLGYWRRPSPLAADAASFKWAGKSFAQRSPLHKIR